MILCGHILWMAPYVVKICLLLNASHNTACDEIFSFIIDLNFFLFQNFESTDDFLMFLEVFGALIQGQYSTTLTQAGFSLK